MDEAVKAELERLRDEDKRQNHRIDELEKISATIQELAISVHTLAHDMAGMLAEQKEQGNRLDALESAPAKKWNNAMDKIIDTIIGSLVGAMMTGVIIVVAQQYIR